ncbi:MAG: hypothetical protein C5B49_07365 [Bdellovibrio sp.]|nr:MAG: hypothetical protein C5B49_07365 [Bdellovibrio sp.]
MRTFGCISIAIISVSCASGWAQTTRSPPDLTPVAAPPPALRANQLSELSQASANGQVQEQRKTHWDFGFGFPQMFYGKASRSIGGDFSLGIGFGGVPAQPFARELQVPSHMGFSEDYQVSFQPSANIFVMQTELAYHFSARNSLALSTQFLYLDVSADSLVRDVSSGQSTMLGNMNIQALEPIINISYYRKLTVSRSGSLVAGIGVNFLLRPIITSSLRGTLPSYGNLSPNTQESISDGLNETKTAAEDYISKTLSQYAVLPALSLSWTWD